MYMTAKQILWATGATMTACFAGCLAAIAVASQMGLI